MLFLALSVPAMAYNFPLFEDFEQGDSFFSIKPDSGWGVAKAHGPWQNFTGDHHLDNCIHELPQHKSKDKKGSYRAVLDEYVQIPKDADNPVLFFRYLSKLYKFGDRIYVDVIVKKKRGVRIDTLLILTRWNNTGKYFKWRKLSLSSYKGKKIKIGFRQATSRWGIPRIRRFAVDNLSICNASSKDQDSDGIPDNLDYFPAGERLPAPSSFTAENSGELQVDLSWEPLDHFEYPVAGYKIYRRKEGSPYEILLNNNALLPPETSFYKDEDVRNATRFIYRIVGVASDGKKGESAHSEAAYVEYKLTPFPLEESFDSVSPEVIIPEGSDWAIAPAHGPWNSFSGNYHLDSNPDESDQVAFWGSRHIVRATMKNRVHIPEDAEDPTLSYWCKMDLQTVTMDDLFGYWFWDMGDDLDFVSWLFYGDRIFVDIHFVWYPLIGEPVEMVHRYIRWYTAHDNTSEYVWDSIPLHIYKGTEIWVDFRKKTGSTGPGSVFVLDDFRISETPDIDDNENGIPDAFETPLGKEKLPHVKAFAAEVTEVGSVTLSWEPDAHTPPPHPAGYRIYRKSEGEDTFQPLTETLLSYTQTSWEDTTLTEDGTYLYYVVPISTEEVEGYPTLVESVAVEIPAPVITQHPQSQTILEGKSVSFGLQAKGLHLVYQWYRNDEAITENGNRATYTLSNTDLTDHGATFFCIVSNMAGDVTSQTATLAMLLAKPAIKVQPEDQIIKENQPVTFSIQAEGSHLSFAWKKNGQPFEGTLSQSSDPHTGITTSRITVDQVAYADDNAVVTCHVSNAWNGQSHLVASHSASLDVRLIPPVIDEDIPTSISVREGKKLKLMVAAIGNELTYQWFVNNQAITGATASTLKVDSVGLQHHGNSYHCLISNHKVTGAVEEGGTVKSHTADLSVLLAAPAITSQPVSNPEAVNEGDSVSFTIKAFGSHLSFEWFKGESLLTGKTSTSTNEEKVITSKITISKADYSDDGAKITCVVKNAWNGQSHSLTSEPVTMDVVLMPPAITS
ncbi:MAG: immunoglobulin domain-containing protein, partial [Desulfobacterales bacterium]|nr:immunoglobulin domain-containing protein [Desulfobacterales bacterium]